MSGKEEESFEFQVSRASGKLYNLADELGKRAKHATVEFQEFKAATEELWEVAIKERTFLLKKLFDVEQELRKEKMEKCRNPLCKDLRLVEGMIGNIEKDLTTIKTSFGACTEGEKEK